MSLLNGVSALETVRLEGTRGRRNYLSRGEIRRYR